MTYRPLVALMALLLLAAVPACAEETYFDFAGTGLVPDAPLWGFPIPLEILRDTDDLLRLVNRDNLLARSYPPDDPLYDMVDCGVRKATYDAYPVRTVVRDALVAMFDAAKADGCNLVVKSAYRSYGGQASTYERYLKRNNGKDYGDVLPEGASEHQTGLTVDVLNPKWIDEPYMNPKFAETNEAQWMAAHAHEYGFIIRYPADKVEITGVNYEPWHLRYVGAEVAAYLHKTGLSLEEFTAEWRHALATYVSQGGEW